MFLYIYNTYRASVTKCSTCPKDPVAVAIYKTINYFFQDEDDVDMIREADQPVHLVRSLERQVLRQQSEIANLKSIIEDLRSSLQLSDAQNLALQVDLINLCWV